MEKTFSHRRLEVVEQRPMIGDFKNRWPALFEPSEVNAEFMRITTKPLQTKFLSQLDHFSDKLMEIFTCKGGVKGQKIKRILAMKDLCDDINVRRECILRSLVVYLNEDPDVFFKEYLPTAVEDAERDITTTVMGIYSIRRDGHEEPEDVGVVVEGIKVLNNLQVSPQPSSCYSGSFMPLIWPFLTI
ncbi:hypothetical protein N1851_026484 [Merluccius polli]|uniref:Uncharacterized protein n=1 Tax=Merluccius polli TaxID=89951 RepID=A0AA47MC13_MERPO|nr:hypothetical protein N1851_026484 [Merluccius polli]